MDPLSELEQHHAEAIDLLRQAHGRGKKYMVFISDTQDGVDGVRLVAGGSADAIEDWIDFITLCGVSLLEQIERIKTGRAKIIEVDDQGRMFMDDQRGD